MPDRLNPTTLPRSQLRVEVVHQLALKARLIAGVPLQIERASSPVAFLELMGRPVSAEELPRIIRAEVEDEGTAEIYLVGTPELLFLSDVAKAIHLLSQGIVEAGVPFDKVSVKLVIERYQEPAARATEDVGVWLARARDEQIPIEQRMNAVRQLKGSKDTAVVVGLIELLPGEWNALTVEIINTLEASEHPAALLKFEEMLRSFPFGEISGKVLGRLRSAIRRMRGAHEPVA
jgi:hypothetical protein